MAQDKNKEEMFAALAEADKVWHQELAEYEQDVKDWWWHDLDQQQREDAFFYVMSKLFKAKIAESRSYRGMLYDVFGFKPNMYRMGMECGAFAISNALHDAKEYEKMQSVTRVEVIDDKGRSYTKYLDESESVCYSLQDDDKTLKIFIDDKGRNL